MFLRQLIVPSPYLHIRYPHVVHLFAFRQLFLITLCPLLLEGNLFNQINLKTIYFLCLRIAEEERVENIMKLLCTERCCSSCSSTRTFQSSSWLAELPSRTVHKAETDRTDITPLRSTEWVRQSP